MNQETLGSYLEKSIRAQYPDVDGRIVRQFQDQMLYILQRDLGKDVGLGNSLAILSPNTSKWAVTKDAPIIQLNGFIQDIPVKRADGRITLGMLAFYATFHPESQTVYWSDISGPTTWTQNRLV